MKKIWNTAANFDFPPLALEETCDVHDTARLLIFVCGIQKALEITEMLAAIRWMKGTVNDLLTEVTACLDNCIIFS